MTRSLVVLVATLVLPALALAGPPPGGPAVAAEAAAAPASDAALPPRAAALARTLQGGWAGQATLTPAGPMSFALVFEPLPAGGVQARTSLDAETFIDLRLAPDADGAWTLTETAGMPGLGVQSHDLRESPSPSPSSADALRFVTADAAFMVMDVAIAAGALSIDVVLRGTPHASFRLQRVPDDVLPYLRARVRPDLAPATSAAALPSGVAGERRVAEDGK